MLSPGFALRMAAEERCDGLYEFVPSPASGVQMTFIIASDGALGG
jgi:hypothetical protein